MTFDFLVRLKSAWVEMIEFVRASKTGCGMSYRRIFQALSQDRSEYAIRYASTALA
ncbi:hypothetical protein FOIG_16693 [Fusarium odoratissimum NRRL 54006]|uniref:Uncharacterized protein n=1 Tax=Fusarium odoratissimum (strain NRRL 54006) TaxID=1089451 RepID=X0IME7_FUSO5|nr:uncharacterized protein FOIG_16693 [Fusarium odoratissimum NRRL 54006]EXL90027.1 hypothetical protein FOIG_16693 [Fusarium odoratissimum NRRL 54006]